MNNAPEQDAIQFMRESKSNEHLILRQYDKDVDSQTKDYDEDPTKWPTVSPN
jgi:hypothetical protein